MSPEEKAKELIEKFFNFAFYGSQREGNIETWDAEQEANAKQCAAICAKEIMKQFIDSSNQYAYWHQVLSHLTQ